MPDTYASLLMAAGYTLKELMEFMGHADLQMVARYVKLLPQPGEDDAAARLDNYLLRATTGPEGDSTT
jgi:integrase